MRLVCTLCVSRSTTARRMDDQPCLPLWYLRSSDRFFSFLSTDLSISPAARMTESSEKSWFSSGFTRSALTCCAYFHQSSSACSSSEGTANSRRYSCAWLVPPVGIRPRILRGVRELKTLSSAAIRPETCTFCWERKCGSCPFSSLSRKATNSVEKSINSLAFYRSAG